jgi:hypothetical protein
MGETEERRGLLALACEHDRRLAVEVLRRPRGRRDLGLPVTLG